MSLFWFQYKTERDGKMETRVEKKVVISQEENGDDIDHDAVSISSLYWQQSITVLC